MVVNTKSIRDPFGLWPMDREMADLRPYDVIHSSGAGFVAIVQGKYAIKTFYEPGEAMENELRMMLLAGDCSVAVVGRLYSNAEVVGFITQYESCVAPAPEVFKNPRIRVELSAERKLEIIWQLCDLIDRLHKRGILHGDIKPPNLVMCSDGSLRLCDFGSAMLEADPVLSHSSTLNYSSPSSCNVPPPPLPLPPYSKTDDLYATGMTVWEIYTGEMPYGEADEDVVEDLIRLGIRVDLSLIDNTEVRSRIVTYLDADTISDNIFPQPWRCIATDHIFCRCTSTPPHTYRKLFRCQTCEREVLAECRSLYVLPTAEALPSNLTCIKCCPIQYIL
ncbi:kinase-like domain-containing protein [Armillaria nabsnona]|nr:kinase-like domain-containing protein [Armillaria nabsnona]